MNKYPMGTNSCCSPQSPNITYIHVGSKKHRVGMQNLDVVFQELYYLEREPAQIKNEELIDKARKHNYIPRKSAIENDYAEALKESYTRYWNNRKQSGGQT